MTTLTHRIAAAAAALVLIGVGPLLGAGPAAASTPSSVRADVSDFSFSSFVADYYLSKDAAGHATLKTVEKLTAVFPSSNQNKGIERKIPDTYRGADLHTTFVSVSDTNGVTKPYSVDDSDGFTTVSTGTDAYVHGSVTYTLTYTQQNVIGEFANTGDQEFYWDTNGTGWSQAFGSLVARVHVDPSLVSALSGHNACYQGAQGSKATCSIESPIATGPSASATGASATPPTVEAVLTASATQLTAGQNMTVAIGFADGTFTDAANGNDQGIDSSTESPPLVSTGWAEAVGGVFGALGLLAIPFAFIRRFVFGQRNAKGRGIIVAQYDVPAGMNLMEAGSLVGRETPSVPAQIVSFAVRGKLRILNYAVTDSGAPYTLELTTADGLDAEETMLIRAFFPDLKPGAVFEMAAHTGPTSEIDQAQAAARGGLLTKGWKVRARSTGGVIIGLALLGLLIVEIAFGVIIAAAAQAFSGLDVVAIPVTIVAMIVAFATGYRGYVLTDAGAEQRDYLQGMQVYLKLAEEDRLRMLQSPTGAERVDYGDKREVVKLYEKLLPFAVLWGVEDEWSKVLAIHYSDTTASPGWFVSTSGFNSLLFASSLAGLSNAVSTSVAPVVSSSGGGSSFGGSFGGGFSGGGGGGGGGGGR